MLPPSLKHYRPYTSTDGVRPLDDVPAELQEYRAARWWNQTMPEFRSMEKRCQAEATAVYIVEQRIESYYASEQAKRMDKDKQKNKPQ